MRNWYDDLCEYYGVTPEEAEKLSVRSDGRKPSFPGSKTCEPVSGKSWQELWGQGPRDTFQGILDFYKDIGSWASFRQCYYRRTHGYLFSYFLNNSRITLNGCKVLEYGCGAAPVTNFIIENFPDRLDLFDFTLVEVPCEHFEFGKWRLKKKAPDVDFKFIEITDDAKVPEFKDKFDCVFILDVFEHLPNAEDVLKNLHNCMNTGAVLHESWIDHDDDGVGDADLEVAKQQRPTCMKFFEDNFELLSYTQDGLHRTWMKN